MVTIEAVEIPLAVDLVVVVDLAVAGENVVEKAADLVEEAEGALGLAVVETL